MAITYIDFYAENPIENKTIADSCIFENINGDGNALWTIYNSNDITITAEDTLYLNADRMWFNSSVEWTTIVSNSGMGFTTNPNSSGYSFTWNANGGKWDVDTKGGDIIFNTYNSSTLTYGAMVFPPVDKLQIAGGSNGQVLTTNGSAGLSWTTASGGGVADADYGDITVSGSGSVWTIDNDVVTYAKMQQASGLSIIGRSSNTSGTLAEITSTANGQVLHRSGSNLHFGTIGDSSITASSITYSRLQDVSTNNRLLGRSTAGAGVVQEITIGSGLTLTAGTLAASGGGLTYFTETQNSTGVNSTIYADSLTPNGTATSIDFVITPKLNGSLLLKTPDGTATGGNKRGNNSIDLQLGRSANTQIAGALRSTIVGGVNNTINSTATESIIYGGTNNTLSGANCGIFNSNNNTITSSAYANCVQVGGFNNSITNGQSQIQIGGGYNTLGSSSTNNFVMIGGSSNTNNFANKGAMISGEQNTMTANGFNLTGSTIIGGRFNVLQGNNNGSNSIIGGISNTLGAEYSVCLGGDSNVISDAASNSVCIGGNNNSLLAPFGRISGRYGYNNINGSDIISGSPSNSVKGSNQTGRIIMSIKTSSTAQFKLVTPAGSGLEVMNGETIAYNGIISVRTSANPGLSAFYEIKGLIRNSSGVLTLLYSNLIANYTDDASWIITQQCTTYHFEVLFTGSSNTFVTCALTTAHSKWINS